MMKLFSPQSWFKPVTDRFTGDSGSGPDPLANQLPNMPGTPMEAYQLNTPIQAALNIRADAITSLPIVVVNDAGAQVSGVNQLRLAIDRLNLYQLMAQTEVDSQVFGKAYWRIMREPFLLEGLDACAVTDFGADAVSYNGETIPKTDLLIFVRGQTVMGPDNRRYVRSPVASLVTPANISYFGQRNVLQAAKNRTDRSKTILGVKLGNQIPADPNYAQKLHDWANGVVYSESDVMREKPTPARRSAFAPGEPKAITIGGDTDTEFIKNQTWVLQEVARVLDVPSPLLGDLTSATYNNMATIVRQWYQTRLRSMTRFYEASWLELSRREGLSYRLAFDLSMVRDLGFTLEELLDMLSANTITIREFRRMAQLPPDVAPEDGVLRGESE